MIAKGMPDKVIAERLGIRFSTVRTYCERIFDKLEVDRRSAVASKLMK